MTCRVWLARGDAPDGKGGLVWRAPNGFTYGGIALLSAYMARPDAAAGYAACESASAARPAQGNVGAGAGAAVGKFFGIERAMKGGIGSASIRVGGVTVAAMIAVNASGDVIEVHAGDYHGDVAVIDTPHLTIRGLGAGAVFHADGKHREGKAMLVYSRLAPLVRDSGCATFGSYILRIREDAAERNRAIMALTTNHTFFYREAHHFEHFKNSALAWFVSWPT